MGALDYELAWIRFLRQAEIDYIHRLTRVRASFSSKLYCLTYNKETAFLKEH